MQRVKTLALIATAFLAFAAVGHATDLTITFDDLTPANGGNTGIPSGYQNLDWSSAKVYSDTDSTLGFGYPAGVVSAHNAATDYLGGPVQISTLSSTYTFGLKSAYFTSVYNTSLNIEVKGFDSNGHQTQDTSFTLGYATPTLESFNWDNLAFITFTPSGGTPVSGAPNQPAFAFDDLTIAPPQPAPEPVTWAGLGVALLGIGSMVRAKRKASN